MKKDIYYCIVLSSSQLDFFAGSKYGIDRMKVLKCLINVAVVKETKYEKKGFTVTLHIGQAALSEVELATRLGYDKKTVSRLLDKMAWLGIITSKQTNRTSIHTIHCVSAWYEDNQKILNPYYVSMKKRHESFSNNGNIVDDVNCVTTDVSKIETEKSDTNTNENFHSGLITLTDNETSSTVALTDDGGNATTDIEQQVVLPSLISDVSAELSSGEYHSLEYKQSPPNNHSEEEVQP